MDTQRLSRCADRFVVHRCECRGRAADVHHALDRWRGRLEQLESLAEQVERKVGHACHIRAGARETVDEPELDRVGGPDHDDRDRLRHFHGGTHGGTPGRHDDEVDIQGDQLGGERRRAVHLSFRVSLFEEKVVSLDIAAFAQQLLEGLVRRGVFGVVRRPHADHANAPHFPGALTPRARRRTEQHACCDADEHASIDHRITSSARSSSACGIVMPSALAVFRLITSSNLDACSTGRSRGWAPRKILST